MQPRFCSTAFVSLLALSLAGAAHTTGLPTTEAASSASSSQDGPRYYAYCATFGSPAPSVWVSDVFSARDYHMSTRNTLPAENSFSAYLGANHPRANRGDITCHSRETSREAENLRNNAIAEWRSDRFNVNLTLWSY